MKNSMTGFLILSLIIVLVGGFIWMVVWMTKQRTQDLQAIAQELKLQFFPKGDDRIAPLLVNLDFFHYGTNCRITNLMHGQIARGKKSVTVAIFDYAFVVGTNRTYTGVSIGDDTAEIESGNDDDRQTFGQTVIVFYDEAVDLPGFNLRPENFVDKIANVAGFQDINFRDFPVFSQRYRLDADRVDEVRDLFQPNLLKFYEGHKICTQANGSTVMIMPFGTGNGSQSVRMEQGKTTTSSSFIAPKEIKQYLDLGLRLLSLCERNLVKTSTV